MVCRGTCDRGVLGLELLKAVEGLLSWLEKRKKMRLDIAAAFSRRTGISEQSFLAVFYDPTEPATIGDFDSQYIPDESVLGEIVEALGDSIGLDPERIKSHYHREESFRHFGEHLLRAGAYE